MKNSILSSNPVQLWLDTPIGAYVGSPRWGNNFEELLGHNIHDTPIVLLLILKKMQKDLKSDFRYVEKIELIETDSDSFLVGVQYRQQIIGLAEVKP
jgi:hypothetical protein